MREVERSLRRLDTDRIDVYLLHGFDADTPLDEQLRALDDLVRHGKVRYVGVCNYQAWQVCRALWVQERIGAAPLIAVQNPYSLLNRRLEEEMFPLVRDRRLGVMAYAPLATGLLSGTYAAGQPPPVGTLWATERRRAAFDAVMAAGAGTVLAAASSIATRRGGTVAQIALAWLLARPEVTCAISGADTDAQLAENLGAVGMALAPEELAELDRASAGLHLLLDGPLVGRRA
jgi:aryl-alcohol dehydrogenase-like predicted oxidoreductase